uniref:KH domain-containing protein n=1 Tax=Parastrongyloides trichosuri TaxID=131310 RepID=A0A0N4ZH96_PARTI
MDTSYPAYSYDSAAYGYGDNSYQGAYRAPPPVEAAIPSPLDHEILIVKGEIQHEINIIDQSGDYGLQFKNGRRLLVSELDRLANNIEPDWLEVDIEKPIKVVKKVLVPTFRHPQFNYVGKLMGPKGTTLQALAKKFRCHVYVLGKGSTKDRDKEQSLFGSGDPQYAHYGGPLHVKVETTAPPAIAYDRVTGVIKVLTELMKPIKEADLEKLLGIPNVDPDKLKNQEEENVAMVATNYLAQNGTSHETSGGQFDQGGSQQQQQQFIPPPPQLKGDSRSPNKDLNFADDYYNNENEKDNNGSNINNDTNDSVVKENSSNNQQGNRPQKRQASSGGPGNTNKKQRRNDSAHDRSNSQTRGGHPGNQRGGNNMGPGMRGGNRGMRPPYQNNWQQGGMPPPPGPGPHGGYNNGPYFGNVPRGGPPRGRGGNFNNRGNTRGRGGAPARGGGNSGFNNNGPNQHH